MRRSARLERDRSIESLEVRDISIDGTSGSAPAGRSTGDAESRTLFDGPALIVRVDGAWRIADLMLDGYFRAASMVVQPAPPLEQESVTVSVRTFTAREVLGFYVELVNERSSPIETKTAVVSPVRWRLGEGLPTAGGDAYVVAPGKRAVQYLASVIPPLRVSRFFLQLGVDAGLESLVKFQFRCPMTSVR